MGFDLLTGTREPDTIMGSGGVDIILGKRGLDALYGGDDADLIAGGAGRDWIEGGNGRDILFGGRGSDVFAFHFSPDGSPAQTGVDRIKDFRPGKDEIYLALPNEAEWYYNAATGFLWVDPDESTPDRLGGHFDGPKEAFKVARLDKGLIFQDGDII